MSQRLPSVFTTYNPKSRFERTLATRLHTLGGVHGYKMYLPDRVNATQGTNSETESRIRASDFFILFSTSPLSKTVLSEIDCAWKHLQDKSRILVIYDKKAGKNLKGAENCTEIFIDSDKMTFEEINKVVMAELALLKLTVVPQKNTVKKKDSDLNILGGLVLAGLGLLLLGALVAEDK